MRPVRALGWLAVPVVVVTSTALVSFAVLRGDDEPPAVLSTTTTTTDRVGPFCAVIASLDGVDPFAAVTAATDPAGAAAAFDAGLATIAPLADDPPAEIAPAAHAYVRGFREFGDLLRDAEYNASRVDRQALAAIAASVTSAKAELEGYAAARC